MAKRHSLIWSRFASALCRWIVLFLVVWTPIQNSLTRAYPILPGQLVWLGEALIVLLIPLRLSYVVRQPGRSELPVGKGEVWLGALLVVGAVSSLLNHVPVLNMVMGYRSLLQYAPVYYVLATEIIPERYVRQFLAALFGVALLQAPVTLAQMLASLAFTGYIDDDSIIGTFNFNQANTLTYFVGMVGLILLGVWRYFPHRRRSVYLSAALLALPFLAGSSRAMLFLLPLTVAYLERQTLFNLWRKRQNLRRAAMLVFAGVLLGGATLVYLYVRGFTVARLAPTQLLADTLAFSPTGNGGRLRHIEYTAQTLSATPAGLWVGMGPGMYTSGAGYFLGSPGLAAINEYFGQQLYGAAYSPEMEIPGYPGEVFHLRDFSQLTSTFGEWGLLGLGTMILIVIRFIRLGERAVRLSDDWPLVKVLGVGIAGIGVLVLLSSIIISPWEEKALAFLLWSIPGLMLGHYRTLVAQRRSQ